ncbi:MAG: TatD family hydrolase [Acidobacteriaceae bacterium]|nr:TatD family hydrolase [Acidobacteriaceae bacterium]
MELADSHCHLDDAQFDGDRDAAIERARNAGVRYMLAIGTGEGPPDLRAAVRLAEKYPFVYATAGVHPNDAPKWTDSTLADLLDLLRHPKVKAMGEIGLDYHWGTPKDVQMQVFLRQLDLAASNGSAIVIHTRDAWEDTMSVLRNHWAPTHLPCVMHCFTGDEKQARECIDLDFYVAFGGVTTFPKANEIRDAARIVPADRLLLETDAPYLAPVPFRGKRNEPGYVAHTAAVLAEVRRTTAEQLASETTANFKRLFGIAASSD